MALANQNGRTTVPISNIMGFFVEGWDNSAKTVVGRLVTTAGLMRSERRHAHRRAIQFPAGNHLDSVGVRNQWQQVS